MKEPSEPILIVYATNSGNTFLVANQIQEKLAAHGYQVQVQEVAATTFENFRRYSLIILGSCTWNKRTERAKVEEGQLQDQMDAFVKRVQDGSGKGMKFAVFGLGDKDYQFFCRAADCLEEFIGRIGGERVWASLRISGFPQDQTDIINEWVESLVKKLKRPPSS